AVSGVEAADAAREIQEHVAIDVRESAPFRALEEDAVTRLRHAGGDPAPALREQRPALRARERGADADGGLGHGSLARRAGHAYQPIGASLRLTCTCFSSR